MSLSDSVAQRYELQDPDVQLMLQVRDGHASAFEELVLRYQSRLLTVLQHAVGTREQAEDLAQEVFMRVFRSRKNYVPSAKFSTWLFRIASNVASNARRDSRRRKERQITNPASDDSSHPSMEEFVAAASGWMPAKRIDKSERAEVVRLALEFLNERQRMAILLSKFEDMSYEEIAESMGLSIQATKSLLSRARESLRQLLDPYMQEGTRPAPEAPP